MYSVSDILKKAALIPRADTLVETPEALDSSQKESASNKCQTMTIHASAAHRAVRMILESKLGSSASSFCTETGHGQQDLIHMPDSCTSVAN